MQNRNRNVYSGRGLAHSDRKIVGLFSAILLSATSQQRKIGNSAFIPGAQTIPLRVQPLPACTL